MGPTIVRQQRRDDCSRAGQERTVTAQTALSIRNLYDWVHPRSPAEANFGRRSDGVAGTPPPRLTG